MAAENDLEEVLRLGGLLLVTKAIKRMAFEFSMRAPAEAEAGFEQVLQGVSQDLPEYLPFVDDSMLASRSAEIADMLRALFEEARIEAMEAKGLH